VVEGLDHPAGKVDIHLGGSDIESLFTGSKPLGSGKIEILGNVSARVGKLVEFGSPDLGRITNFRS